MNHCPTAHITFLDNGLHVSEKNNQADTNSVQFFPYRAVQSVRYTAENGGQGRGQGGTLTIWIAANGTPGAGGLSYRYHYPCGDSGRKTFDDIIGRIV